MKQVAQNYRSGELAVLDVPEPACRPGGVLVRSEYSLISTGTELMKVSRGPPLAARQGAGPSRPGEEARRLHGPAGPGGDVPEGDEPARQLHPARLLPVRRGGRGRRGRRGVRGRRPGRGGGQRVRPARRGQLGAHQPVRPGAGGVDPGTRRSRRWAPSRCRAFAGRSRSWASSPASSGSGSSASSSSGSSWPPVSGSSGVDTVAARCGWPRRRARWSARLRTPKAWRWSSRSRAACPTELGADHVFLAAGGGSNEPVEVAARLGARPGHASWTSARPRLDLPWNAYYEKELDVRFSRSYGPGRYDDRYELDGIDYPAGYVRWTERRNLGLLPRPHGHRPALPGSAGVERASGRRGDPGLRRAAQRGAAGRRPPAGLPGRRDPVRRVGRQRSVPLQGRARPGAAIPTGDAVRLGFVGAGNYATSMLLPHLAKDPGASSALGGHDQVAVDGQRPAQVRVRARHHGRGLRPGRPSVDAVFVVTRHRRTPTS